MKLTWLGHASFLVEADGLTLYIDPWKVAEGSPKANYILLTHSHYDHFSMPDLTKLSDENTVIIGTDDTEEAKNCGAQRWDDIDPNEELVFDKFKLFTVRAYNTNKEFHPKDKNWLGYILEMDGKRYYFAGDCDIIPEHSSLGNIDVAIVPASGIYVMTADEAAQTCIENIKPKTAIPCHWGDVVGHVEDAQKFVETVTASGIKGILPEKGKSIDL